MKRPHKVGAAALFTAVAIVAGYVPIEAAIAGELSGEVAALPDGLPEQMSVIVPFDHPVSFDDAIQVMDIGGNPVIAYRFESSDVVGEYSLQSAQDPASFLSSFIDYYGTTPQVMGVIVLEDTDAVLASDSRRATAIIDLDAPDFVAKPAAPDSKAVMKYNKSESEAEQSATTELQMPSGLTTRWDPDLVETEIFDAGISNGMYFTQFISWISVATSPAIVPDHWGLEFEVNIYTDHPDYQSFTRPGCSFTNYKSRPFAQNQNWNWSVFINVGNGLEPGSGLWGAYADYNDLFDPCNKNSMAIGIADPHMLPFDQAGIYSLQLNILAPRGLDATSRVGGVVQAVNRHMCEAWPAMTFTDCMGAAFNTWPGPGDVSRPTLAEWRNWRAPYICWKSYNYGTTDPFRC